jgi:ABC-2 type transport system ATP-binding protein
LAQLKGLSKGEATQRLRYWFDKFDIADWWHKKIQDLSKGMAQKIQFIVTVLHRPKLLIFDEPFSGFDPVNAALMAKEILQLRDEGATVIFSTHRMESVEEMCDHIVLLHQSEKILEGSLTSLQKQFQSRVFEIGLQTTDKKHVMAKLSSTFGISEAHFQTQQDELKFHLQWDLEKSSNELIQALQAYGEIFHFVAAIPTVNEIFMKAVSVNIE